MNPLEREGREREGFECQVSLGSEEIFLWILPFLSCVMQVYQTTVQWDLVSVFTHRVLKENPAFPLVSWSLEGV